MSIVHSHFVHALLFSPRQADDSSDDDDNYTSLVEVLTYAVVATLLNRMV